MTDFSGQFRFDGVPANRRPYTVGASPFVDLWVGNYYHLQLSGQFLESFREELIQDNDGPGIASTTIIPTAKIVLFDRSFSALDKIILPLFFGGSGQEPATESFFGKIGAALGSGAGNASATTTPTFDPLREIRWQYGWTRDSTDPRAVSPIRSGYIVNLTHEFQFSGVRIELELTGRVDTDIGVHTRAFGTDGRPQVAVGPLTAEQAQATVKPSDIVRFLATEMGFSEVIVEETEPVPVSAVTQVNQSNIVFISLVLVPLSRSKATGSAGYLISAPDNKTLVYSTKTVSPAVKRRYYFGKEKDNQVLSYRPALDNSRIITSAVDDLSFVGFSPIDKEILRKRTTIEEDGKNMPRLVSRGPTVPKRIGTTPVAGRVYITPLTEAGAVEIYGQHNFEKRFRGVFRADMVIVGDPSLGTGDLIDVVVLDDDGNMHWTSNNYSVTKATNIITPGQFQTTLELMGVGSPLLSDNAAARIKTDFESLYDDVREGGTIEVTPR